MRPVILIGPMGAGKSAIGRRLARRLEWDFVDTDLEIQARTGVDISLIFEKEGEEGFRRRETQVLEDLLRQPACVVATGGGAVLAENNRETMRDRGIVVFLSAEIGTQLDRTRRGRHRPLLDEPDPERILSDLYAQRLPLYRDCAALESRTDGRHVEDVARSLARQLRQEYPENFNV